MWVRISKLWRQCAGVGERKLMGTYDNVGLFTKLLNEQIKGINAWKSVGMCKSGCKNIQDEEFNGGYTEPKYLFSFWYQKCYESF